MKWFYDLMKRVPLLPGILGVSFGAFVIRNVGSGGPVGVEAMLIRIALSFATLGFLYMISGAKVLENSGNETGYAFKKLIPFLIYAALLGGMVLLSSLRSKTLRSDWPVVLLVGTIEMLFVGIYEELSFRALINDAILYQFREKKRVFVFIAVISSFVFGVVHVLGADVSTPLAMGQAVMKTITTGLWGFAFLIVYWKTHNIWACAVSHMLYDVFTGLVGYLFEGKESHSYVLQGTIEEGGQSIDMAAVGMGAYIFDLVFMLIITVILIKVLKTIDFDKIRKEW